MIVALKGGPVKVSMPAGADDSDDDDDAERGNTAQDGMCSITRLIWMPLGVTFVHYVL